ncbi:MAG: carboxypeptidase-like regulatory domain-containing protein, partial [Bacteroidota bacterium]
MLTNISAQNGTQTVRGRIVDQESKQPLFGATVFIQLEATKLGSVTDADGYFKIQDVPFGRRNLQATYVGYELLSVPDIIVTAGKEVVLNLTMTEAVVKMNDVVITYDRKKDPTVTNN